MQVIVLASVEEVARAVVDRLEALVRARPAVLALPTGGTPRPIYAELVRRVHAGLDVREVTSFNLDELVGLPPSDPRSFHAYMQRELVRPLGSLGWQRIHLLPGDSAPAAAAATCRAYEDAIAAAGGLDLALLGLGLNGHVAFNEPGSPWDSRTRLVELAPTTAPGLPRRALTMGIGTILEARELLLVATGEAKSAIVQRMLTAPASAALPATALFRHDDLTIVLDQPAARALGEAGRPAPVSSSGEGGSPV